MKKIIISISLLLFSALTVFAQVENIKNAQKKAKTDEFTEAEKLIDAALQDPATKNSVDAWYTKGFVYYRMFDFEDSKRLQIPPETPNWNAMAEASYKAYKAWLIADSLDVIASTTDPKRKGKLEYRKGDAEKIAYMYKYIPAYGDIMFNKRDYKTAKAVYADYLKLPSQEMLQGVKEAPNASLIAQPTAKDSTFFFTNENLEKVYQLLYRQQVSEKDTVAFLNTLDEGAKLYPNNTFFLGNRIQYNINTGKEKEALEGIELAISKNPDNYLLYYIRGFIYAQKKNGNNSPSRIAKAKEDYLKAIEKKPDFADAYAGYGDLVCDEADAIYKKGDFASSQQAAETEYKKAREVYTQGLEYYNKAIQYGYKDEAMLRRMASIYSNKMKMKDKAEEIRALLKK